MCTYMHTYSCIYWVFSISRAPCHAYLCVIWLNLTGNVRSEFIPFHAADHLRFAAASGFPRPESTGRLGLIPRTFYSESRIFPPCFSVLLSSLNIFQTKQKNSLSDLLRITKLIISRGSARVQIFFLLIWLWALHMLCLIHVHATCTRIKQVCK